MMRFMDSFDHCGTNDLLGIGNGQKWTGSFGSLSTQASISSGTGRYLNSLRFVSSSITAGIFKIIDNQASWVIGFAFKFSLLPTTGGGNRFLMVSLYDGGTTQCDLTLNTDGTLSITRNGTAITNSLTSTTKSSSALSINTWYYIEWLCTIASSISAHTCKVNVNGSNTGWLDITTGQNTRNTSNATANQIVIMNTGTNVNFSSSAIVDYDDLYICDGQGSTNNTFLGDTRIEARLPIGNGTNTDFSTNLNNAYLSVNELTPDGDTGYIYSATTNQISTFTIPATNATPSSIFAMQMIHCSKKSDAGNRQLADLLRSGSTNYPGTTQNLGNSYQYYPTIYETDPNTSAAWTSSAANALEIGVKQIT